VSGYQKLNSIPKTKFPTRRPCYQLVIKKLSSFEICWNFRKFKHFFGF